MELSQAAWAPKLAFLLSVAGLSCATVGVTPSPQGRAVLVELQVAQKAFEAGRLDEVDASVARARTLARGEAALLFNVEDAELAMRVERGDLDGAWKQQSDLVRAAERNQQNTQGLHDRALFLAEARGDLLAAQLEAGEMMAVTAGLEHPPVRMQLGNLWQRAHTLRAFAETLEGPNRAAALAYAQRARMDFNDLAVKSQQSLPSIDILTEQFAALDGDCALALKTARQLKVDELDPQDASITAAALERCGDVQTAHQVREHILATKVLGLFHSVYRFLARQPLTAR